MARIKPSEVRQAQRLTFAERHYAGLLSEAEEEHRLELLRDAEADAALEHEQGVVSAVSRHPIPNGRESPMRTADEQHEMLQHAITATHEATLRSTHAENGEDHDAMRHEWTVAAMRNQEVQALTAIALELREQRVAAWAPQFPPADVKAPLSAERNA